MPKIVLLPKYEIQKHSDEQGFVGSLELNSVYEIVHTAEDEEGKFEATTVMTIDSITDETYDDGTTTQIVHPNILFFEDGFEGNLDPSYDIDVRDIKSIKTKFVSRRSGIEKRRSKDPDPFTFTFKHDKSGRIYSISVDKDHYVGVVVNIAPNRTRTYVGYIEKYDEKTGNFTMTQLECVKGMFSTSKVKFSQEKIVTIYTYHNEIGDYDAEIAARAAEKRNQRKAEKAAAKAKEAEEAENSAEPTPEENTEPTE